MPVLICTQREDPHVASVCRIIESLGDTPVLFERYRRDHAIVYKYVNGVEKILLKIGDVYYDPLKDFQSVWWRIKPVLKSELPCGTDDLKEQFCTQEWRQGLHSLGFSLEGLKWINPLVEVYKISKKPFQLSLAQQCGLLVPETIITNEPQELLNFFQNKERVIYKTLSSFFSETTAIFTSEIDVKNIAQNNPDSIAIAPGIFQELIEKDYELRVTMVGNQCFVVKIDSQKNVETMIDWRHGVYDEMFSEGFLSGETTQKLFEFHKKSNLVYAAYDFIVDKQGKEIFLECNPSGQWLWLEDQLGLSISQAVAEFLVH